MGSFSELREQIIPLDAQRIPEPDKAEHLCIVFTGLDSLKICNVHARPLRELFLSEADLPPGSSQISPEFSQ